MCGRKGRLRELFSYARFNDDLSLYSVEYRDLDTIKGISLKEFLSNPEIPDHRIIYVKRGEEVIYRKSKMELKKE